MAHTTTGQRTTGLGVLAIVTVALTAMADWFFYGHVIGWTLGAFAATIVIVLIATGGTALRRRSAWVVGTIGALLAAMLIDEPGPLRIAVTLTALAVFALTLRLGWSDDPAVWLVRMSRWVATGWLRGPVDFLNMRRWSARSGVPARVWTPRLGPWVGPVLMSAVFVGLFAIANPVIEGWVSTAGSWLAQAPELLEFVRLIFWSLTALGLWALLRARPIGGRGRRKMAELGAPGVITAMPRAARAPVDTAALTAWVVRCLICFNLAFAMQTATDVMHLWGGMRLPDGMSVREYARRGAYPLVATALLAAVFVLITFRSGAVGKQWRAARVLVYIWLAQNTLLVVSAVWRLSVYVEAYQMTRLRMAAGLWMALVAFGIVTIVVRIARRRSNRWLLRINTLAAAVLLVGACTVNFDRIIADYNVNASFNHDRDGDGETREWVDVAYLEHLGYEALPGLYRLEHDSGEAVIRNRALDAIARLESLLAQQTDDWRGWTWRRGQIREEVAAMRGDRHTVSAESP